MVKPWVKSALVAWSIVKPVWLKALLVQLRSISLEEAAVAVRPLGAAGGAHDRQSGVGNGEGRHLPLRGSLEEIRRHNLELIAWPALAAWATQLAVTVVQGEL